MELNKKKSNHHHHHHHQQQQHHHSNKNNKKNQKQKHGLEEYISILKANNSNNNISSDRENTTTITSISENNNLSKLNFNSKISINNGQVAEQQLLLIKQQQQQQQQRQSSETSLSINIRLPSSLDFEAHNNSNNTNANTILKKSSKNELELNNQISKSLTFEAAKNYRNSSNAQHEQTVTLHRDSSIDDDDDDNYDYEQVEEDDIEETSAINTASAYRTKRLIIESSKKKKLIKNNKLLNKKSFRIVDPDETNNLLVLKYLQSNRKSDDMTGSDDQNILNINDAMHEKKLNKFLRLTNNNFYQNDALEDSSSNIDMTQYFKTHRSAGVVADLDSNSLTNYYTGLPLTNGFVMNKVNPLMSNEFAYLNRNKLVNRRLAIRKQIENSAGLKSISKSYPNYNKANSDFKLVNPREIESLNKYFDDLNSQLMEKFHRIESSNINNENNNNIEIVNNQNNFASMSLNAKDFNDVENKNVNSETIDSFKNDTITSEAHNLNESLINNNINNNFNDSMSTTSTIKRANKLNQLRASSITIVEKNNFFKSDRPDDFLSPFSYHIPRRPPNEKVAPMFTIGRRCFTEKEGGGRTSWQKEYFSSKNPYLIKSDFNREMAWPSPTNYKLKSLIGDQSQILYHKAPMISIGTRLPIKSDLNLNMKPNSGEISELTQNNSSSLNAIENEIMRLSNQQHGDDPNNHANKLKQELQTNVMQSVNFVSTNAPKISIKFRPHGTQLWQKAEETPGPGSYDHNKFKNVSRTRPNYTLPQAKLKLNHF